MAWEGPLTKVGPATHEIGADYKGRDGTLKMNVPGRILANDALMAAIADDLAPEQVANVASMPGIVGHALAMPDIHWGYGFPIGGVAAFDPDEGGVVSPGGVGFDINCGVRLLATSLTEADVRAQHHDLMDALFAQVPAGFGSRGGVAKDNQLDDIMGMGAKWAVEQGFAFEEDLESIEERGTMSGAVPEFVGERARKRGRRGLGSLGSGNHFLELQTVNEILDEDAAKAYGVAPDQVVVMIHTGSRGLGHQVCQDTVETLREKQGEWKLDLADPQLAAAPLHTKEAEEYLGAMSAAANFAFVNRALITYQTREVLSKFFPDIETRLIWDVCHNIAKFEEHQIPDSHQRKEVCVHRKGATRAFAAGHPELAPRYADVGQPVVVPGDMGRQSFLLRAQEGAMTSTFGSSCHGAGRALSRKAAKERFEGEDMVRHLWETKGILVKATSMSVAAEEAPGAYKDVSEVVNSVAEAGIASPVARLKPLGVVKG